MKRPCDRNNVTLARNKSRNDVTELQQAVIRTDAVRRPPSLQDS